MSDGKIKYIEWNDGSGDFLSCELLTGNGNGEIAIASPLNEYIDREQTLTVSGLLDERPSTPDYITILPTPCTVTISQEGIREEFSASDDGFVTAYEELFTTLKVK